MAIVEVWDQYGKTGHASVWINQQSYCSFHPKDANAPREVTIGTKGVFLTRASDERHHGRPIFHMELNFLDDGKMINQLNDWIEEADTGRLQYYLFGNNCSRIAAHLLCIGAGIEWTLLKHIDQLAAQIKRLPMHHDSGRITELIQDGIEDYAIFASRTRTLAKSRVLPVLLGLDVLSRALIWTPGDVKKLATLLQPHNH